MHVEIIHFLKTEIRQNNISTVRFSFLSAPYSMKSPWVFFKEYGVALFLFIYLSFSTNYMAYCLKVMFFLLPFEKTFAWLNK